MAATTIVASAARTTTGASGAIPIGSGVSTVELELEVTAASGTSPTLQLGVQWSDDGVNFGNNDGTADTFASVTAAGNVVKNVPVRAPYMQITWTIGGTSPSFTFAVLDTTSNAI
jgi:hypothetical protein